MLVKADPAAPALLDLPINPMPPGARTLTVPGRWNVPLRVALWPAPAEPRGTVVIVQGRAEFIEKYFETIADLQQRGFAVCAFDLRGQGGSGRITRDPHVGHVHSFHDYVADVETVMRKAVMPSLPPPYTALAHSTGGAVVLLGVRRLHPLFSRLVTVSPLLGFGERTMPDWLFASVLEVSCLVGLRRKQVSPRRPGAGEPGVFESNPLTSDRGRFTRNLAVLDAAPALRLGAPTIGWVKAARDTMVTLKKADLVERMTLPTLIFASGRDRVVDARAVERFGRRLVNGGVLFVPGARHELMMEADRFREPFWAAFDAFVPGEA
jgi:lysophospholipase